MITNRRYYYLKLKESFFNTDTIIVLESMPDGLVYTNLLLKMYLMSLQYEGMLLLHENIPHTPKTIASVTRHSIKTVECGIAVFLELGLVEQLNNGAYYMTDIQLFIGQSSTEGDRKRLARKRLEQSNLLPNTEADICPHILEIELKKDKKTDTDRAGEVEKDEQDTPSVIMGYYHNVRLTEQELLDLQTEYPYQWELYIEKLSAHMASKGKQYDNHAATIRRWLLDDQNKTTIPTYTYEEGESL